jgi:hypothetical protein
MFVTGSGGSDAGVDTSTPTALDSAASFDSSTASLDSSTG